MFIPRLLYRGKLNQNIIESIRKSTLEGMTFEGVVCKGTNSGNMCKIKSQAWLDKLKTKCGNDIQKFEELC